jgi:hypothetical protein
MDTLTRHRQLVMLGVVRTMVDVDDDPWELDEVSAAIVDALDAFDETRRKKPLRIPKGFEGGGRFRKLSDTVFERLQQWAKGDLDNPFEGVLSDDPAKRREQIRKVAKERGLTIRRGAPFNEIANALLDDVRKGKGKSDAKSDEKPEPKPKAPAKKATPRAPAPKADRSPATGEAAMAAVPVSAVLKEGAHMDSSSWSATGFEGLDKPDRGAVAAVTKYLRAPWFANAHLRGPSPDETPLPPEFQPSPEKAAKDAALADRHVRALDRVMAQSEISEPILVHRGARIADVGVPDGDASGYEWTDAGYASTAVDDSVARHSFAGRGRVLLHIHAPEGTPALAIEGLGESEILLGRGLRYRVTADHGIGPDGSRELDVEIVSGADAPKPDSVTLARQRQADIDTARGYADAAAQLDELLANEASTEALLSRLDNAGKRHGITEDLAPVRAAAEAGDLDKARAAMAAILSARGITQDGKAGESGRFTRTIHQPIDSDLREGQAVETVRPGFTLTRPSAVDPAVRAQVAEDVRQFADMMARRGGFDEREAATAPELERIASGLRDGSMSDSEASRRLAVLGDGFAEADDSRDGRTSVSTINLRKWSKALSRDGEQIRLSRAVVEGVDEPAPKKAPKAASPARRLVDDMAGGEAAPDTDDGPDAFIASLFADPDSAHDRLVAMSPRDLRALAEHVGMSERLSGTKSDMAYSIMWRLSTGGGSSASSLRGQDTLLGTRGKGLSSAQKAALTRWSSTDVTPARINTTLREGRPLTPEIERLDEAMAASTTSRPVVLYRGVNDRQTGGRAVAVTLGLPDGPLPEDLTGHEWTEPGFAATTQRRGIAEVFAAGDDTVLLEIRVPPGTHATRLPGGEDEVLLDRGLTFRVVEDRVDTKMVGVAGDEPLHQRVLVVEVVPREPAAPKAPEPDAPTDPEALRDSLDLKTADQLKDMIRDRNKNGAKIKLSGRKRELVDRLVEDMQREDTESLTDELLDIERRLAAGEISKAEAAKLRRGLTQRSDDVDAETRDRVLALAEMRFTDEMRVAGRDVTPGRDKLHHWWVYGEGRKRWHDWTSLYAQLAKIPEIGPAKAKLFASRWFYERFGYYSGSDINRVKHGKPPRGKRVGPG